MNIESLNSLLRQSGIALNQKALEQLWAYHNLLREANSELNLTRIFNFESMVRKHYVDSLIVPVELKKLLKQHAKAKKFFDSLSYTNQKEYAVWITSAKRTETRLKRLAMIIPKLLEGKKNPSAK